MIGGSDPPLLEREHALATLAAAVDALAGEGRGAMVGVVGEAGIGKSRLLERAGEAARAAGIVTLRARAHELERAFPYGVALQLLETRVRRAEPLERERVLVGAAGLAAPLLIGAPAARAGDAEGGGAGTAEPGDAEALAHGLAWVIANLAEEAPLCLIVDDAHWADPPSVAVLDRLAPTIADLPLLVLLAARPAEPGADAQPALDGLLARATVTTVEPRPLSAAAVAALAERALPGGEASTALVDACHTATRGNPLLLRSLLGAIVDEGATGEAAVERAREIGPEPIAWALEATLERLPPACGGLVRALAVLGDDVDLAVAARLAALEASEAEAALESLAAAGVASDSPAPGFVHPIVRAAVYETLGRLPRDRMHREAARLLAGVAPLDSVAGHLLAAGPAGDAGTEATLRDAARLAVGRGAPATAATYLRRALAEDATPPGTRGDLLAELGRAEAAAGHDAAEATIGQAIALAPAGEPRVRLALDRGRALIGAARYPDAVAALEGAVAEAGDLGDPDLHAEAEATWVAAALWDPTIGVRALGRVEPLLGAARQARSLGERGVLAHAAGGLTLAGEQREQAIEWALRAWGEGELLVLGGTGEQAIWAVTFALSEGEELDACGALVDVVLAEARRTGAALDFAMASYLAAVLSMYRGMPLEAVADFERALDPALGWEALRPSAVAHFVLVLLELGEVDRAEAVVAESWRDEPKFAGSGPWARLVDARGRVRLARRDPAAALEDFRAAGEIADATGAPNPKLLHWRAGAATALNALGRRDEALELIDDELARLREWGAPGGIGGALRLRCSIATPGAVDELSEAAELLAASPLRVEHAHALADLGSALRASGERTRARAELERALELARAGGAAPLVERVREELAVVGAPPVAAKAGPLDELTPTERRVARLVAEGMTNREAAEALFVTRKAIQYHLGNVYRKLDLASREELRDLLRSR